jgi:hypothetical protein
MVKKIIAVVLASALIYSTAACYSTRIILPGELMVKEKQPIDSVMIKDGSLVRLENGFVKDGNVYGDVIKSIPVLSISEAYDNKGNIITNAALANQAQLGDFDQYISQIVRVKLENNEIVNFLEVRDYKNGVITVLLEKEKLLFTSDGIAAVPFQSERHSIDSVVLKDGRRVVLKNGYIMNNKVYEKKIVIHNIPLKNIVKAYDKNGHVISRETIADYAGRKDFFQWASAIVNVELDNGEVISFKKVISYKNEEMIAIEEKDIALFSLSEINRAEVESFDILGTVGCVFLTIVGITLVVVIIASATYEPPPPTSNSCPLIYSFDREKFVLDAEPFGGSICDALKRTDYCRLDYPKLFDKKYVFEVVNKRDETQFIDEFNLCVIDHQPQYTVIPDSKGRFHLIDKPIKPEQVFINGRLDTSGILINDDQHFWSSDLSRKVKAASSDLKDEIILVFPKPKDATGCRLIINGCNTEWGSRIISKIIELAGADRDQFTNPSLIEQIKWISVEQREELFHLKVQVLNGNDFSARGIISGGGPSVVESQVVPMDIKGISGDYLKVKLNPPAGFWKLNWIAIDYGDSQAKDIKEVKAIYAKDTNGKDISESIQGKDKKYYTMSRIDDEAVLMFNAPPLKQDLKRSLFAKMTGYYELHIKGTKSVKTDILDRMVNEPGFIVKYLLMEYSRSNDGLMAKLTNY